MTADEEAERDLAIARFGRDSAKRMLATCILRVCKWCAAGPGGKDESGWETSHRIDGHHLLTDGVTTRWIPCVANPLFELDEYDFDMLAAARGL